MVKRIETTLWCWRRLLYSPLMVAGLLAVSGVGLLPTSVIAAQKPEGIPEIPKELPPPSGGGGDPTALPDLPAEPVSKPTPATGGGTGSPQPVPQESNPPPVPTPTPTTTPTPSSRAKPQQEPASDPGPASLPIRNPSGSKPLKAETPTSVDPTVKPTRGDSGAEPAEMGPLPASMPAPGGASMQGDATGAKPDTDPFFLHPDKISPGKQKAQVSVEVRAPKVINLNRETTIKLVVRNESTTDAAGVRLVYQLPEGLKFNSSTPEATPVPGQPLFQWSQSMLAAGSEWVVVLKVTPTSPKPAEHAATVSVRAGSKAISTVQEPRLKVEAVATPARVLKGKRVDFQITVRNPGTGPARKVVVQAKLSGGLRAGSDDIVELTIPNIDAGQSITLDTLSVDTVAGGEQTCTIDVQSPDVIPVAEDQRIVKKIEVTRPELTVKIEGDADRISGQASEYKITVTNPGTAPTKAVRVQVALPREGGRMKVKPEGAEFIGATRSVAWRIPQLEPGQSIPYTFTYDTDVPGAYRAVVEATAGELRSSDRITTEVSGLAMLDVKIEQAHRMIDVGKKNIYDIVITNSGTKEATKVAVGGELNKNLKVTKAFNVDNGQFAFNANDGRFLFPVIERLGIGQSVTLSMEVEGTASGAGGCKVQVGHSEMTNDEPKVEDVISTMVTGAGRRSSTARKYTLPIRHRRWPRAPQPSRRIRS